MKSPNRQRGLTYVETMIAVTVISFMILGSVNLITAVYKGITASTMKTYALNMVSENIDLLKQNGFDGLPVTPDSCLPNPLSNLLACTDAVESITVNNQIFVIYKYVQYAVEDTDGNLVPKKEADMTAGMPKNLKQITVTANYLSNNVTKTTSVTSFLTNKDVAIAGSSVSGIIQVHPLSGADYGPGLGSNATVYFLGYPQYTSHIRDSAGNFTVENVMPGSYTLYVEGIGFDKTFYASNPLVVPNVATTITGINFLCNAIIGSAITGHIYIGVPLTPTVTLTPTPTAPVTNTPTCVCQATKILLATGRMPSKTSDWAVPTYIVVDDANYAIAAGDGDRLYTEFLDYSPANTSICSVQLHTMAVTSYNGELLVSFSNNTGNAWANGAGGWTGTVDTTIGTIHLADSAMVEIMPPLDITSLNATWDWAKVNKLGACYTTNDARYFYWWWRNSILLMDASWLSVCYGNNTPTFTSTLVPTNTPTPNATETFTPWCGNGAEVIVSDGLSAPYTVTSCDYTISNINPLLGTTDISATLIVGTDTYYAIATGVTVSPGTTAYQDLLLQKITGIPSIKGLVKDKSTGAGLPGIDVYLGITKVATTGGGGAYTASPVDPVDCVLDASAPGYLIENRYTYSFTISSGLRIADTLYMIPIGNVSGLVTDSITGNPIEGYVVEVRNSSDATIASGTTDASGIYMIQNVPVGTSYKVKVITVNGSTCVSPAGGYYAPPKTTIVKGVTTLNLDFKVKQAFVHVTGKVQIDGLDKSEGVVVMIIPSSVTITPDVFREDNAIPGYKEYTGRNRVLYPNYGLVSERDATFDIMSPVSSSYNIYAYYSYISYTGTVDHPIKTLLKYYKKLPSISVSTTNLPNQNITGTLGSWTAY